MVIWCYFALVIWSLAALVSTEYCAYCNGTYMSSIDPFGMEFPFLESESIISENCQFLFKVSAFATLILYDLRNSNCVQNSNFTLSDEQIIWQSQSQNSSNSSNSTQQHTQLQMHAQTTTSTITTIDMILTDSTFNQTIGKETSIWQANMNAAISNLTAYSFWLSVTDDGCVEFIQYDMDLDCNGYNITLWTRCPLLCFNANHNSSIDSFDSLLIGHSIQSPNCEYILKFQSTYNLELLAANHNFEIVWQTRTTNISSAGNYMLNMSSLMALRFNPLIPAQLQIAAVVSDTSNANITSFWSLNATDRQCFVGGAAVCTPFPVYILSIDDNGCIYIYAHDNDTHMIWTECASFASTDPTLEPTLEPTFEPSLEPTLEPTFEPTEHGFDAHVPHNTFMSKRAYIIIGCVLAISCCLVVILCTYVYKFHCMNRQENQLVWMKPHPDAQVYDLRTQAIWAKELKAMQDWAYSKPGDPEIDPNPVSDGMYASTGVDVDGDGIVYADTDKRQEDADGDGGEDGDVELGYPPRIEMLQRQKARTKLQLI